MNAIQSHRFRPAEDDILLYKIMVNVGHSTLRKSVAFNYTLENFSVVSLSDKWFIPMYTTPRNKKSPLDNAEMETIWIPEANEKKLILCNNA